MNRGLDHRRVRAQLPSPRHLLLASQLRHPIQELVQGVGPDQLSPAQQGRVIRRLLQPQPAELAEHQAIAHKPLGVFIAPGIQVLDEKHPQNDLSEPKLLHLL
jgi:hypothetical protein